MADAATTGMLRYIIYILFLFPYTLWNAETAFFFTRSSSRNLQPEHRGANDIDNKQRRSGQSETGPKNQYDSSN
jgi:hypothetical protein